jgi:hypothetical protein
MNINFRLSSDSQESQSQMSVKDVPNTYDYSWRRYSKSDAPSVNDNVSTVQIGRTVKLEPENRPFKYVLGAATACGVKIGAMTMTYLNQGQSYELRLKKTSHIPNYEGENLKTVLRLGICLNIFQILFLISTFNKLMFFEFKFRITSIK